MGADRMLGANRIAVADWMRADRMGADRMGVDRMGAGWVLVGCRSNCWMRVVDRMLVLIETAGWMQGAGRMGGADRTADRVLPELLDVDRTADRMGGADRTADRLPGADRNCWVLLGADRTAECWSICWVLPDRTADVLIELLIGCWLLPELLGADGIVDRMLVLIELLIGRRVLIELLGADGCWSDRLPGAGRTAGRVLGAGRTCWSDAVCWWVLIELLIELLIGCWVQIELLVADQMLGAGGCWSNCWPNAGSWEWSADRMLGANCWSGAGADRALIGADAGCVIESLNVGRIVDCWSKLASLEYWSELASVDRTDDCWSKSVSADCWTKLVSVVEIAGWWS
jgi:hypothetical protein